MDAIKRFFNRVTLLCLLGVAAIVSCTIWAARSTEAGIEQSIRRNFTAAGLLARLQLEGERMRRFEKEMFIYAAVPDRRNGYVKEFNDANNKLLVLLDTILAPSGKAFDDAERQQATQWKSAAIFYVGEFDRTARRAESVNIAALSPDQRAALTLELNEAIKAGKDRFRELLGGAAEMRAAKEKQSQSIATEINAVFGSMVKWVALAGSLLVLLVGIVASPKPRRRPAGDAAPTTLTPFASVRNSQHAAVDR